MYGISAKVVGTDGALREKVAKDLEMAWGFVQLAKVGWREPLLALWQQFPKEEAMEAGQQLDKKPGKTGKKQPSKWPKAHEAFKREHGVCDKDLQLPQVKWFQNLLTSQMTLTEREMDNAALTFAKFRTQKGKVAWLKFCVGPTCL